MHESESICGILDFLQTLENLRSFESISVILASKSNVI